ncbi:hypothetical protein J4450_07225 [Candidatus Micrarchaeota archaeon]|nr:hypothetical protein [Candidatus Micrarchaeota archaeon]
MRTRGRGGNLHTDTIRASDPFRRYKKERKQPVRKLEVEENKTVQQLKDLFRNYKWSGAVIDDSNYPEILGLVRQIAYSAKDVELFSIAIAEFQSDPLFSGKAGFFLSALINAGNETDYIIHTEHLEEDICFLGYQNTKNIRITGDAGMWVGMQMVSGTIAIEGNAGFQLGMAMQGGTIIIRGNAGMEVGAFMRDGEIHLNGSYRSLCGDIRGGRIFHKGELIYPKVD